MAVSKVIFFINVKAWCYYGENTLFSLRFASHGPIAPPPNTFRSNKIAKSGVYTKLQNGFQYTNAKSQSIYKHETCTWSNKAVHRSKVIDKERYRQNR